MKKCLYQGACGSYSYAAAKSWDSSFVLIGKNTFKEVFSALEAEEAEYALIPLENSLAGSIHENYDLFQEYSVHILGEIYQKIEHCLLSAEKDLAKIKKVFSHPKALEQCALFFKNHPCLQKVIHFDTAGAAEEIAKTKMPQVAAIASKAAGMLYNLHILKENIQDEKENYTRFALIAKNGSLPEEGVENKCSCMLTLPHVTGALLQALQIFASKEINLTKVESRPFKKSPFEYIFYLDCTCRETNKLVEAMQELKKIALSMCMLGIYPAGQQ
jgi:prephenate dehydratase